MRSILFVVLTIGPFLSTRAGAAADAPAKKISVLILDGMNNHDWPRNTRLLKAILESPENGARFTVDVSTTPPATATASDWDHWRPAFSNYDVILSNFNSGYKPTDKRWPPEVEKSLVDYVKNGGGLVVYHAANNAFHDWPEYNDMIGLGWREPAFGPSLIIDDHAQLLTLPPGQGLKPGHPKERDFLIHLLQPHPITAGMPPAWLHQHEQLTHGQHGPAKNMTILTYAVDDDLKQGEPMDWVIPYGKGRVYVTMLGHLWKDGPETALQCAGFQTLLCRGVEWAATGNVTIPIPADFPTETKASLRVPATSLPAK